MKKKGLLFFILGLTFNLDAQKKKLQFKMVLK
jgi:hypothetical protein